MNYDILIGEDKIADFQRILGSQTWPEFLQHDQTVNEFWPSLYTDFSNCQFAVMDGEEIVAVGNSIPLNWQKHAKELPNSGVDWAMAKANSDYGAGLKPNLLVPLQILINDEYKGQGISYLMLDTMKDIARNNGIEKLALPVRPTLKSNYPLILMSDYICWKDHTGLPFDPWLKVHIKIGGEIVGVCSKSMEISGSIGDWEKWTGIKFPGSGDYILEKALIPVSIDIENNIGRYVEPNVWVVHSV